MKRQYHDSSFFLVNIGDICHSRNRTALNILKDSYKYIHFPIRKALVLTMTMSNRCSRQLLRFLQGGACLCGFDGYNQARCTTLLPETSSDAAMQTLQTWIIGFSTTTLLSTMSVYLRNYNWTSSLACYKVKHTTFSQQLCQMAVPSCISKEIPRFQLQKHWTPLLNRRTPFRNSG